jgi:predicted permease
VLSLRLQPTTDPHAAPGSTTAYFVEVIDRLAEIPGVRAVGASQHLPLTGFNWRGDLEIEGRPIPPGATPPSVTWRSIEGEYFRAMDIPLLGGRAFGDGDRRDAPAVVIVNEAMARRWWPNESPIGRRINVDSGTQDEWATIVGIVGSVRFAGLHSEPGDEIYRPLAQQSMGAMSIVLRTSGDPLAVAAPARRVVHALDPDVPISDVRALQQLVTSSVARPRIVMTLLLAFAGVGLALGAIGIYGVVAYSVGQRTREIGVRVALGAHHGAIVRMVIAEGLRFSLAGVALGIVGALAATRVMRSLVFEVSTTDPTTYAVLASLLVCIAGLASWLPARRAAKVDPMVALRAE